MLPGRSPLRVRKGDGKPGGLELLKVVFDTNIIVSGLIAHSGSPYKVLEAWRRGDVVLLVSKPLVDEVVDVLRRPFSREKRQISRADITKIRRALETDTVMISPKVHLKVIANDPDDDRILECALEGGADYLISGDRHLLGGYRKTHQPVEGLTRCRCSPATMPYI